MCPSPQGSTLRATQVPPGPTVVKSLIPSQRSRRSSLCTHTRTLTDTLAHTTAQISKAPNEAKQSRKSSKLMIEEVEIMDSPMNRRDFFFLIKTVPLKHHKVPYGLSIPPPGPAGRGRAASRSQAPRGGGDPSVPHGRTDRQRNTAVRPLSRASHPRERRCRRAPRALRPRGP